MSNPYFFFQRKSYEDTRFHFKPYTVVFSEIEGETIISMMVACVGLVPGAAQAKQQLQP